MRHDSARVTGKNYRLLDGRPLYHHIVTTLLSCPYVREIVIDTDSPFILRDAPASFEHRVRMIERASHLLGEFASISEILMYDFERVEGAIGLHTHSTNPLLRELTIRQGIERFLGARERHDSLLGVTPRQVRFYWPDGRPINHDPDNLVRTQDLPPVFEENSCLYLFDRDSLFRRRNRVGERPLMFEIQGDETCDIDDEHGWRLAEALVLLRAREQGA